MSKKDPAEKAIRDIRRKTRRHYSSEEKIRIVLEGLRGEESIATELPSRNRRGVGICLGHSAGAPKQQKIDRLTKRAP